MWIMKEEIASARGPTAIMSFGILGPLAFNAVGTISYYQNQHFSGGHTGQAVQYRLWCFASLRASHVVRVT
jgi:hypothetical protein